MIVSPFFRLLNMANIRKHTGHEAGFTLVEILLSLVLIGAISLSVLSALQVAAGQILNLRKHHQALALAQAGMEKIYYFRDVHGYDYLTSDHFPSESNPDGISGFVRLYLISSLDSTREQIAENMKKITVRVQWNKGQEELTAALCNRLRNDGKNKSYIPYWK